MIEDVSREIEKLEKKLTNLGEKCINGEEHELEPFVYYGKQSNFEEVCRKCHGFKVNPREVYLHMGLLHYINTERFGDLLKYSESIKEK